MKKLELTNIGRDRIKEYLDYYSQKDPYDRLRTYIILPNYSSLAMARDYLSEKKGALATDNIMTLDDLAKSYQKVDCKYLARDLVLFVIRGIVNSLDMDPQLSLELSDIILDFKAQNIRPRQIRAQGFEDLDQVALVYEAYEDKLETLGLGDYIDSYYHGGKNLEKLDEMEVYISGFIEFRPEEWVLIRALAEKNQLTINYPFKTGRKNIKETAMVEGLKDLGFEIVEDLEIGPGLEDLAYNFLGQRPKEKFQAGSVCGTSTYQEVKTVLNSVKEDLDTYKAEDIALIIPPAYGDLVKILSNQGGLQISSLNEMSARSLVLVRSVLNLLDLVKDKDKQRLISLLENSYLGPQDLDQDQLEALRTLDPKYINSSSRQGLGLDSLLDQLDQVLTFIREDPIRGLLDYLDSIGLESRILDHYSKTRDLDLLKANIKALSLIKEALAKAQDALTSLSLPIHDQLDLVYYFIENASYYEEENKAGIQVLYPINAIGLKVKKAYILGLNVDYPPDKDLRYFYQDIFKDSYQDLGFRVQSAREDMDNEIIKFAQALTLGQKLVLSYTDSDGNKSKFFTWLEKSLDLNIYERKTLEEDRLLGDLLAGKNRLDYLEEDQVSDLNGLFMAKSKRLAMDPPYWGQIEKSTIQPKAYSVRMLETFNKCPFSYLMAHVNKLESRDLDYRDQSYIDKGNLYHLVLMDFFKENPKPESMDLDQISKSLSRLADLHGAHMDQWDLRGHIIKSQLENFIGAYIKEKQRLGRDYLPKYFEEERHKKLRDFHIYGRIDRIDVSDQGTYLAYDYKSRTTPSQKDVRNLDELQLGLYYYLIGLDLDGVAYGSIENAKIVWPFFSQGLIVSGRKDGLMDDQAMEDFYLAIEEAILNIDSKIQEGDFFLEPRKDSFCSYCDYKDICRKEERTNGI